MVSLAAPQHLVLSFLRPSVAVSGLSPVALSVGYSLGAVCRLLREVASLVAGHRLKAHGLQQLQHVGSVVPARGLSCSEACGIFPDQGSNLRLLHWQADSLPRSYQGSPQIPSFYRDTCHPEFWSTLMISF